MDESGFLLIDKPVGMTSRAVDNAVGRLFHTRHIGHLGTLDPFASGMLLLAVNKANKCLPYVEDGDKTYVARLALFSKTSTGDCTGEVIETCEKKVFSKQEIEDVLASFKGKSMQIPPMTSAIKINGEALYKKAHRGEEIKRKPREIEVFSVILLSFDEESILFQVKVSKGTYIRTLGEDIAERLGVLGYLSDLRRIGVGQLPSEKMIPLEKVSTTNLLNPSELISLPKISLSSAQEKMVLNGVPLELPEFHNEKLLFVDHDFGPLAVYIRKEGHIYVCERGLF